MSSLTPEQELLRSRAELHEKLRCIFMTKDYNKYGLTFIKFIQTLITPDMNENDRKYLEYMVNYHCNLFTSSIAFNIDILLTFHVDNITDISLIKTILEFIDPAESARNLVLCAIQKMDENTTKLNTIMSLIEQDMQSRLIIDKTINKSDE